MEKCALHGDMHETAAKGKKLVDFLRVRCYNRSSKIALWGWIGVSLCF